MKKNFQTYRLLLLTCLSFGLSTAWAHHGERLCKVGERYHEASSAACRGQSADYCEAKSGPYLYVKCPQSPTQVALQNIPIPLPRPEKPEPLRNNEPTYANAGHPAMSYFGNDPSKRIDKFFYALSRSSRVRLQTKRKRTRKKEEMVVVQVNKMPVLYEGESVQFACGAEHIRHHRSHPWANPIAACMLMGAVQEWRKTYCPNNHPDCRVMIGDASFGFRLPEEWPHNSHREGLCFDIWPMRKDGVGLKEVTIYDYEYSSLRTQNFIEILRRWGADDPKNEKPSDQFFFNDPNHIALGYAKKLAAHHDHIHVCFRPNQENRQRCREARFDLNYCPSLTPTSRAMIDVRGPYIPFPTEQAGELVEERLANQLDSE